MPEGPLDWRGERLGDVASVRISNVDKKSRPLEIPVTLCNYLDAYREDYLDESHPYMVATATASEITKFGVRAGDVLVTKDSETPDDIGIAAVIEAAPDNLVCGYHLAIVRPTAQINPVWLAKQFGTTHVQRYLAARATGSTRYGLSNATLCNLPLLVPRREEQDRIVEFLSSLDEAIRWTERLIAKLELMKQGQLDDLLTRGISEGGALRDPERHPEQFRESVLGRIPIHWDVTTLGSVARRITDGTHQAVRTVSEGEENIPFLYVSCIRDGEIIWQSAGRIDRATYTTISKGREPDSGMVLFTAVGSYGHAAGIHEFTEFAFQRHIACIYPNADLVDSRFLAYWLNGEVCKRHGDRVAIGNAQRTVTLAELARYPVAVPPLDEQLAIAGLIRGVDTLLADERALLLKSGLLKQGFINDLLTGRVRMTKLSRGDAT